MNFISNKILSEYQVRKTKKQKTRFIEFIRENIPEAKIEQGGFGNNRNIVVGDVDKAEVVFAAHYDTCAVLPFPNLITPKNILFTILYGLIIALPFLVVFIALDNFLLEVTDNFFFSYWVSFVVFMGLMLLVFMGGVPNKHTANDNTSGVVTLCELMFSMTSEERGRYAFVFFDNEENGLLGSVFFRKKHKAVMKNKLIVNVDCVGDGDHILFVSNKKARKYFGDAFYSSFKCENGKNIRFEKTTNTFYPSDQMGFPVNIAVATLKKKPVVGYYLDKIHTKKDIHCDETNIEIITSGFAEFVSKI